MVLYVDPVFAVVFIPEFIRGRKQAAFLRLMNLLSVFRKWMEPESERVVS